MRNSGAALPRLIKMNTRSNANGLSHPLQLSRRSHFGALDRRKGQKYGCLKAGP